MKFKTFKLEQDVLKAELEGYKIIELAQYFDKLSQEKYGIEAVVTSFIRTMEDQIKLYGYNKQSLHLHKRAIDMRSWLYTEDQIKELTDIINSKWIYDPSRSNIKCAVYHKISGGAFHWHLQVHPNTVVKN